MPWLFTSTENVTGVGTMVGGGMLLRTNAVAVVLVEKKAFPFPFRRADSSGTIPAMCARGTGRVDPGKEARALAARSYLTDDYTLVRSRGDGGVPVPRSAGTRPVTVTALSS